MNTKHTPGKWAVDLETGAINADNGQVTIGTIYGADDYPCLDLEDDDEGIREFVSEWQANARLIAAAPELLAACEAFLEAWAKSSQLEKTDVALRMATRAIALATGQQEVRP